MGLMRNIYYRFGFGAFTNQDELYFVDFANFSRHNLPVGWNDEIGGVFQVLDSRRMNVFTSVHFLCRIFNLIWKSDMASVRIFSTWESS